MASPRSNPFANYKSWSNGISSTFSTFNDIGSGRIIVGYYSFKVGLNGGVFLGIKEYSESIIRSVKTISISG